MEPSPYTDDVVKPRTETLDLINLKHDDDLKTTVYSLCNISGNTVYQS